MLLRASSRHCDVYSLKGHLKKSFKILVIAAISVVLLNLSHAKIVGLNNEGCSGARMDSSLAGLRERLPQNLSPMIVPACRDSRCDGGFAWLPYLINKDRAWVFYTLPEKGNWVGVTVRNICTNKPVMRGEFLNEEGSEYLKDASAYAVGWPLDNNQPLLMENDNVAIRLLRYESEYWIEIYGLNPVNRTSALLDQFAVSPL